MDNIHVEILSVCVDGPLSLAEIAGRLELKGGTGYLKGAAAMLRENNLIAYTIPEIPLSRLQKYQITDAGLSILKQYTEEKKGLVAGLVKGPVRGLVAGQVSLDKIHVDILSECVSGPLSPSEIAELLELKEGTGYLKRAAAMLRENDLIAYTIPEKPKSKLQKYQITEAGLSILKQYTGEGENDN